MAKALRACASARALLRLDDIDGACNRAYYAMFDAARAALLASEAPIKPDIGKTHSGLISAFGEHLVKNGPISKEIGRLLKRAEEIRIVADYTGGFNRTGRCPRDSRVGSGFCLYHASGIPARSEQWR